LIFSQVMGWLRERPVDSLLIGSDAAWARAAAERFTPATRRNPLAWVRYCRRVLGRLRDERHQGEVWDWDTWPTDRIDLDGRYAHQPARRICFADIEPDWLRELAKRWAPANATYYRGEIPHKTSPLPRFIHEFVMGQLEQDETLDRLPDLTTRTAVVILIETGLRSIDCLRLPFDPVTTDEAGAPYLKFVNHKLSREAIIPISRRLIAQIRAQQQDLRERFPAPPPFLLPGVRMNPDGTLPLTWSTLNNRLQRWLADCDIRDAAGQPVKVTAHQFRHTPGTRISTTRSRWTSCSGCSTTAPRR
jgi:integrase